MKAKRNTQFKIKGNPTLFKVTRTVGDTIYYRMADKPYYLYDMSPANQMSRARFDEIARVVSA